MNCVQVDDNELFVQVDDIELCVQVDDNEPMCSG